MAKVDTLDIRTGGMILTEVPDKVIAAANLVYDWLEKQPQPATCGGLCQFGQATPIHRITSEYM